MKITFNHKFGHQEQGECFVFDCSLVDVGLEEYDWALEQGFLITIKAGQPQWYQCRSTRVRTEDTNYQLLLSAKLMADPLPLTEMDHIYTAYCYYKKFRKYFEVGESLPEDRFIEYRLRGDFVAWTKLRHYTTQSIETCLFVWDYADPEAQLGSTSLEHEIAWAKSAGYKYVYLGPGYERSSQYKARISGFEWWTGSEWSQDTDHYRWLCKRDSKLKSVSDLYDLQTTAGDKIQAKHDKSL
jgi:hypothetical protein